MKKFIFTLIALLSLAVAVCGADTGGLVAVKVENGVFLSWQSTGENQTYTLYRDGQELVRTKLTNYTHLTADASGQYSLEGKAPVGVWQNQYLEIPISAPEISASDYTASLKKVKITPALSGTDIWSICPLADGSAVLINESGSVLDVNAQSTAVGARVGTYAYNGGDNQKFILETTENVTLIKGKQSDLYLCNKEGLSVLCEKGDGVQFKVEEIGGEFSEAEANVAKSALGAVTYSAGDCSVGDLDGDGELEIVLKWDPSDAKDASQNGKTGKVYIDAYKTDSTRLWRIDLGPNIRAGAHDTQFIVYDLDMDGCAEVAFRTADATVDGLGNVLGDKDALWTDNWSGKNLEGPLYLTVFDGKTGKALDSVPYDPNNNEPNTLVFGDGYGNRSERYNACVAFLEENTPFMVFQRGYYAGRSEGPGRTVLAAYRFKDGKISKHWRFDTMDADYSRYIGQGNHNISVGDCDNDGKDEIFLGSLTIDHDGKPLWCSYMGHGDAMHLGDFDPNHSGLEFFEVHESETAAQKYGFTVFAAESGEVLHFREGGKDTGRGMIANVAPFGGSYVAWAGSGAGKINSLGENIDADFNSMNFRIYWDGDLYDELLDGTSIFKINSSGKQELLFNADGCSANNGSKSTPCIQADILGDWREEVIWRTADNTALRIYTTTIPTAYSIMPLMTDHVYRMGVVWQNSSYNQPPHLGYYLGGDATLKIDSRNARLNGQSYRLNSAPFISDGVTMVPLRFIADACGAKTEYNDGSITVSTAEKTVTMTIGSLNYSVNGVQKEMETAAQIVNDTTMVPVRAIAEEMGMNVSWDGENRIVKVFRTVCELTEGIDMKSFDADISADSVASLKKEPVKIFIAGDSTAQSYGEHYAPQAGWGQMLGLFFDDSVEIVNRAMAGRSLKSFFNEGRWQSVLDEASRGDYVIIQFGQNDGAQNKPERYLSFEDFSQMLETEYILPALEKGLIPVIATQTQGHWFGSDGLIAEPSGTNYASLLRDCAKKYNLTLLEVNALSRALENALGESESEKLHLYAQSGEYDKYPDGVRDNTHYSYAGAFEIAKIVAEELCQIPDLEQRRTNGYSIIQTFSGEKEIDIRQWQRFAQEFALYAYSPEAFKLSANGETVLTEDCTPRLSTRVTAVNGKITLASDSEVTVQISPVLNFAPDQGIDTSAEEFFMDIPDGAYDFTFTKADNKRGNIFINSYLVGANVDMYGTVDVGESTRYTYKDFHVENGAKIKVQGLTSALKSVEAAPSSSIFPAQRRIFVAGDSTLCNYYPIVPAIAEADIQGGTLRTGWAQLLERYTTDESSVINLASSGDWARNWADTTFPTVLKEGKKGDIFIIQFGINDRNRDDKSKDTFAAALERMVKESTEKGLIPVLVKPQPSVGYSWGSAGEFEVPNGNNGGFFDVVKTVADKTGCTFIDLYALAGEHFAQVGRDYVARNYHLWNHSADEIADKLHLSFNGAKVLSAIFAEAANDAGLFSCGEYCFVKDIKNGVYLFEGQGKVRLLNLSGENREITVTVNNAAEKIRLSRDEEISFNKLDAFEVE